MKPIFSISKMIFLSILLANFSASGQISISNRPDDKVIVFGNSKLQITLEIKIL